MPKRRGSRRGPMSLKQRKAISRALKKKYGNTTKAIKRKLKGKKGKGSGLGTSGAILLTSGGVGLATIGTGLALSNPKTREQAIEGTTKVAEAYGAGEVVGKIGGIKGYMEGTAAYLANQARQIPKSIGQAKQNFIDQSRGYTEKSVNPNIVQKGIAKARGQEPPESYTVQKPIRVSPDDSAVNVGRKAAKLVKNNPVAKATKAGNKRDKAAKQWARNKMQKDIETTKRAARRVRRMLPFEAEQSELITFNTLADMAKWVDELQAERYAEFAKKGKKLSAAHKKKISVAMKNRGRSGSKRQPLNPELINASTTGAMRLARAGATISDALLRRRQVNRELGVREGYRAIGAASQGIGAISKLGGRSRKTQVVYDISDKAATLRREIARMKYGG